MKALSFCIPIKNRFEQISQTLIKNLKDNYDDKQVIEFVLVDFNSTDGLQTWIFDNFKNELDSGYLKYFYTEELKTWHASIAKNTAHLYSTGKICVNLDCDNYTGVKGNVCFKEVNEIGENIILHQFSGHWGDGTCGRVRW